MFSTFRVHTWKKCKIFTYLGKKRKLFNFFLACPAYCKSGPKVLNFIPFQNEYFPNPLKLYKFKIKFLQRRNPHSQNLINRSLKCVSMYPGVKLMYYLLQVSNSGVTDINPIGREICCSKCMLIFNGKRHMHTCNSIFL